MAARLQKAIEMRWLNPVAGSANACKAAKRNENALADPAAGVSQWLQGCKTQLKFVG